ncbi:hypothetical protein KFK09_028162 [Dendrobium nobile]|uniref:Short-chain dehydrogenase TIC 32, chloroplastic n=1 Tax=Dendrobium nobile TaxID=94219 RepID=A0A8T3A6N8_DENNO|nr:hypothetical protein KFK09_028162 [Dendrobium nobile]
MLETIRYLIGSAGSNGFGSKSTAEEVTEASPDLRSITAIITGATSGIGAETARVLAMRGARLVIPARNLKAAQETKARIKAEFPGSVVIVLLLDLSSFSSVRSFVANFLSLQLPLNLLINNAGKFSHNYALSEDGIEMTFATNYLGHFLLTKLLMEKMTETARITGIEGRIINVSSGIHAWFTGDGLRYLEQVTSKKIPYNGTRIHFPSFCFSELAGRRRTTCRRRSEEMTAVKQMPEIDKATLKLLQLILINTATCRFLICFSSSLSLIDPSESKSIAMKPSSLSKRCFLRLISLDDPLVSTMQTLQVEDLPYLFGTGSSWLLKSRMGAEFGLFLQAYIEIEDWNFSRLNGSFLLSSYLSGWMFRWGVILPYGSLFEVVLSEDFCLSCLLLRA